jgi:hypothetical protein
MLRNEQSKHDAGLSEGEEEERPNLLLASSSSSSPTPLSNTSKKPLSLRNIPQSLGDLKMLTKQHEEQTRALSFDGTRRYIPWSHKLKMHRIEMDIENYDLKACTEYSETEQGDSSKTFCPKHTKINRSTNQIVQLYEMVAKPQNSIVNGRQGTSTSEQKARMFIAVGSPLDYTMFAAVGCLTFDGSRKEEIIQDVRQFVHDTKPIYTLNTGVTGAQLFELANKQLCVLVGHSSVKSPNIISLLLTAPESSNIVHRPNKLDQKGKPIHAR